MGSSHCATSWANREDKEAKMEASGLFLESLLGSIVGTAALTTFVASGSASKKLLVVDDGEGSSPLLIVVTSTTDSLVDRSCLTSF